MKSSVDKINAVTEISDLHQSSNMSDFSVVMDCIPFKTWTLSKFSKYYFDMMYPDSLSLNVFMHLIIFLY